MKRMILLAMISLLVTILSAQAQESTDGPPPNLTGDWTINQKLSDDLQRVMMKAMGREHGGGKGGQGGGRRGGMGGGRGGSGRGGSGNPGNQADRANNPQAQQRAEEMKKQYSRLEIFQEGLEFNITNGLDITRLLYTDGRTNTIWTQRGEATATAGWDNSTLVVRWKTRQETLARVRNYRLENGGKRLVISEEIQLPGKKEMVKVRLVYDR